MLLFALLAIHTPILFAQQGEQLYQKGDSLLKVNLLDSAELYYMHASNQFQSEGNKVRYFDAQMQLLDIINSQGRYTDLITKTKSIISELEDSEHGLPVHFARTYRKMGAIEEFYNGDMNKALNLYKKALTYNGTDTIQRPHIVFPELLKDCGVIYSYMNMGDSSRIHLKRAMAIISKFYPENKPEQADLKSLFAMTYYNEFKPKIALEEMRKAMDVFSGVKMTRKGEYIQSAQYGNMSDIYNLAGYYDSALYMLDKKKALEDKFTNKSSIEEAYIFMQRSSILGLKGNIRQAIVNLREAIRINTEVLGPDHLRTAQCYMYLAQFIIEDNGSFEEAEGYFDRAYNVYSKTYGPNHIGTATVLLNFGNLYLQTNDHSRALEYYQKALEIQRSNNAPVQVAELHDVIGDTYIRMGQYQLALKTIDQSISTYKSIYGADHEFVADTHTLKAAAYKGLEKPDMAMLELQKAENIYTKAFGRRHQKTASLLSEKALISRDRNDITSALQWIQKAIISNSYEFASDKIDENPELTDFISGMDMLKYLRLKAQLLRSSSNDISTLQAVQNVYGLTLTVMDELAKAQKNSTDIMYLNSFYGGIYDEALDNLFALYRDTDKDEFKEQMFQLSERSKAKALELNRSNRNARSYANIPQTVIDQEKQVLEEIAYIRSRLLPSDNMEDEQKQYFENRLFRAERERDELLAKLERDHKQYFNLKYETSIYDSKEVQKNLTPKEAYLEFHRTENSLYAFVLKTNTFEVRKVELPTDFDSLIFHFSQAIRLKQPDEHKRLGGQLYRTTIAPVQDLLDVEKITILPDRALWNINFDLLTQDSHVDSTGYLIEKYAISYAYSASLLYDSRPRKSTNKRLLAFSYENQENGAIVSLSTMRDDKLNKIPGTAQEIAGLSHIMDGDYYYGSSATEKHFKQEAPDYSILHLALHGEVDYEDSDNSKLYFSGSKSDSLQDEILYPFELYNMNLNADLAVLSACETGAGKISSGEGVMSLGRAFQYAGVSSLLLSQWEVSDPVSPVIMASFYENLKAGKDKAQALRLAKLSFLESADNVAASPYYWGGFFILGSTDPIQFESPYNKYLYLWLSLLLALLYITIKWFSKRKRTHT